MATLSALKRKVKLLVEGDLHKIDVKVPHTVLGSEYGGWPIIDGSLNESSIVFSVGVGEDISFDLGVIDRYKSNVYAFDPTPRSSQWIASQKLPRQFHYYQVGISAEDGEADFFPPSENGNVSFSNAPGREQHGTPVRAKVLTLASLLNHASQSSIDVLKMDVEGFEYGVLKNILAGPLRPSTMLIEFHHRLYKSTLADTRGAIADLRANGYKVFYVSATGREFGFTRS